MNQKASSENRVAAALLTGGGDRPYVFGLGTALASNGAVFDLIGSDDLDFSELRGKPGVKFLNLRGNQRPDVSFVSKMSRVFVYYVKLICYAAAAKPAIFHILWNNKFQFFDRTLLMLYYKLLGKKIVFTAHNVNAGIRDSRDTFLNRLTLRIQYGLCDHLFVHTEKMKLELIEGFGVEGARITIIPFGINNSIPNTSLTPAEARQRLGIGTDKKVILFFGNILPYKGLEYLVEAFQQKLSRHEEYRLIIAGVPGNCESYWAEVKEKIREDIQQGRILLRADFIPDEEAEVYFKAADVLVLPYRHIYQSGVLFTGFKFGLPALVADVGSLKDDIVEGKTGIVFRPEDSADLAGAIERYFASELFKGLSDHRQKIRDFAIERHSWDLVAQMTMGVYAGMLHMPSPVALPHHNTASPSLNAKSPSRID